MPTGVYRRTEQHNKNISLGTSGPKHYGWRGGEISKMCTICGKIFKAKPYRKDAKYCSYQCSGVSKKDKPISKKHKRRISKNNAKYWLNKKIPSSMRRKMSEWNKKVGKIKGEKNPNWKGGVSKDEDHNRKLRKVYHGRRRTWEINGGKLTIKRIQIVYENNIKKYGSLTCYLCKKPIKFGKDCLEHKIPLSRGGTNKYINLAIAHRSCNGKKYNRTEKEYKWQHNLKD